MANVRSANTFYIDTQYSVAADELAVKNIRVLGVTVTATAASAIIVLADSSTATNKLDLRVATSGDSAHFDFSDSPVVFPNGIRPKTLTNALVTVIVEESRG
jgi:hypothetical protein